MPSLWLSGGFGRLCSAFLHSAFCLLHFPERGFGWLLPYAWLILQGPAKGGGAPGSIKVIPGACPARVRRDSHESPGHPVSVWLGQLRIRRCVLIQDTFPPHVSLR